MKKLKNLVVGGLVLALAVSLVAGACAPAAPEEVAEEVAELEEEIADLEDEVAAKDREIAGLEGDVADLEDEIAALKKPAEVTKILVNSTCPGGWYADYGPYLIENLEAGSDGRFEVEVVYGEAIVPTEEQLDALRDGTFDMIYGYTGYYKTKMPLIQVQDFFPFTLRNGRDVWALYNERGFGELADQEYGKYNVKRVATYCSMPDDTLFSTVPVRKWEDLAGLKIRSAGTTAEVVQVGDASTVWFPGEEIYTGLASGLIDAATYSSPNTGYAMGWHEVSNYWIRPSIAALYSQEMIANMDFWNSLSEADQVLASHVSDEAGWRFAYYQETYLSAIALDLVREAGVEVIYWDADSIAKLAAAGLSILPEWTDPAAKEAKEILLDYMRFAGYVD